MVNEADFEKLVQEGIDSIGERFLGLLNNVAIVIADEPSSAQQQLMRLDRYSTLLGLYEGIPQTARDRGYFGVLPDKITIFRGPILAAAGNPAEVRTLAAETVRHEIAHHFGMDEGRVARAMRRRK